MSALKLLRSKPKMSIPSDEISVKSPGRSSGRSSVDFETSLGPKQTPPSYLSFLPTLPVLLINLASIVEKADEGLLPAVYKEVGAAFEVGPSQLGLLTFIRAGVQSLASPFAGYLAMHYDRAVVIGAGTMFWALSTAAVGLSTTYWQCAIARAVNGVGLAVVVPALQSFIADSYEESKRGVAFGWLNLTGAAGSIIGGMATVMMAGMTFHGIAGWRFAFILMGCISALIGYLVLQFVVDPRSRRPSSPTASRRNDETFVLKGGPLGSFMSELRQMVAGVATVIRVRTFQILILQGVVGSFPWQAMVFFTMWFQLIGFTHEAAAWLGGFYMLGIALGNLIGGTAGDRMAIAYPNSGRIMVSQFSTFSAVPFTTVLLIFIPQQTSYFAGFGITLFIGGLLISWNQAATNNPIFAEVVPAHLRTMIYACDRALEGAIAAMAAPLVGILAERVFGYRADQKVPESGSPSEAHALSRSLFWCMAVPFIVCGTTYGLLYRTYSVDRDRARAPTEDDEEEVGALRPLTSFH